MLARLADRPFLVALILGIAAQLLFAIHLGRPSRVMFDEVHYVPAARTLLALERPVNAEHPLLGKEIIAAGILLFGDNPVGWRAFSTVAATATVLAVYVFLWLLLGSTRAAMFGALFVVLNQSVFVQARIGMLDGFLAAFVMSGLAALLWALRGSAWRMAVPGLLLGLAVAVKWTAAPYVALACLSVLAARRTLPAVGAAALLGLVAIAAYFVTFLPAFWYAQDPLTLARLIPYQLDMYALQTQILQPHSYQSDWWSWPLMLRPIWYFYEPDNRAQRGVLLIGNPAILWGGLAAVTACWWAWFRERAVAPLIAAGLWTFSLAMWALIPKSLGFFYYYYLSSIFICIALAVAFEHYKKLVAQRDEWFTILAIGLFVYFYPILSAAPLANVQAFTRWTWFPSWR